MEERIWEKEREEQKGKEEDEEGKKEGRFIERVNRSRGQKGGRVAGRAT